MGGPCATSTTASEPRLTGGQRWQYTALDPQFQALSVVAAFARCQVICGAAGSCVGTFGHAEPALVRHIAIANAYWVVATITHAQRCCVLGAYGRPSSVVDVRFELAQFGGDVAYIETVSSVQAIDESPTHALCHTIVPHGVGRECILPHFLVATHKACTYRRNTQQDSCGHRPLRSHRLSVLFCQAPPGTGHSFIEYGTNVAATSRMASLDPLIRLLVPMKWETDDAEPE